MAIWEEKGRTNTAFNAVSDHQGNRSLAGPFTPGGGGVCSCPGPEFILISPVGRWGQNVSPPSQI